MKTGIGVSIAVAAIGLTGMVYAFLSSASPYVSVKEAKTNPADGLHLKGAIVPGSIQSRPREAIVSFTLRDDAGETLRVLYHGNAPEALTTATQVVAIGTCKGGIFDSNKLLLKCPSKYESKPSGS